MAPLNINSKSKVSQVQGFERALDHFASWCAEATCRLGSRPDAVLSTIKEFLVNLDQQPLSVAGGRTLSKLQGVRPSFATCTAVRAAGDVAGSLNAAIFDKDGSGLLLLADASDRRDRDGNYGQLNYSFPAIRCLDNQDDSARAAQRRLTEDPLRPQCWDSSMVSIWCPHCGQSSLHPSSQWSTLLARCHSGYWHYR